MTRVEDTVQRIAHAYGIPEVGTFATPTALIISLGAEHHMTIVRGVRRRTISLDRVSALNALSRQMAIRPLPPDQALSHIRAIETMPPPFPTWMDPLFSGLSAAAATMLVGGTLRDFGPALIANALVQAVQRLSRWFHFPESIGDFIAGAAAVFSALALNALVGSELLPVVAGGIMILLPGTAFTTSVRDAMAGDLLSAVSRALEATLKAAALAAGVASALSLTGRL